MATVSRHEDAVVDEVPKRLFIGGEWRDAAGGGTLAVEDPSTGEPCARSPTRTPEDALAALDAARRRRTSGRQPRPASAARSCGAPSSC